VWSMEDWSVVIGGLVCECLMEDGCVVDGALVCGWWRIGV
jgi:hypothetical protein